MLATPTRAISALIGMSENRRCHFDDVVEPLGRTARAQVQHLASRT